ncbi:transposable element Tc3 transposase [Trichonephila clavipes]|nr:transposable element Tc3 transposase [Trichonephila clavipes]
MSATYRVSFEKHRKLLSETHIGATVAEWYSVCTYHSTPCTAEWSVRKTSIAWSTLDTEPHTSPLRRQWCNERRMWAAEWNEVVFTDESRSCLQHPDGRIRVWRHCGERMLNSCVMHRHTGTAADIMVWGFIGYHSRTPLVRIAGTSNSQSYISEVLEPVVLPYLQGLDTAIFQQDNARPHVARIVQRFFVNHQIELLPWPARFPDLSPTENMWSMVAQRLTQITPPAARSTLAMCGSCFVCCTPRTHPKSV